MATQPEDLPEETENRDIMIGWLTVILAFSIPLYRPWLNLASTLIMLIWVFAGGWRPRLRRLRHHRLTLAVLAFLILNLTSLLWSEDPSAGFRYVAKYRYLLLIPMLASTLGRTLRSRAAVAFQVGSVGSVVLSLAVLAGILHIGNAYPGNPSPTMAHLDYTLVLALASLLALVRVLFGAMDRTKRLLWLGAFALSTAGLLVNIGRSGQFGFVFGLGVLLAHWAYHQSVRRVAAAAVVAVVGLAALWVISPPGIQRMGAARVEFRAAVVDHDYESNLGGRVAATTVAGRIFREHPILGTGAGGNMAAFRHLLDTEFLELKPAIYWYRHFHNQYTQIATELGLLGLLSLAWIFWELIRGPHPSRELRAAAWVVATVYLVGFLGEPFLHKQIPLVAFAVLAGLISSTRTEQM